MNDSDLYKLTGNFVNDSFNVAERIGDISSNLKYLAKAFRTTGNQDMAETLFQYGIELDIADESIRKICGNRTTQELNSAQEMSGAILSSCLARIEIAKQG